MQIIKIFTILSMFLSLVACTQIDNYILGKDNTPKPSTLRDIAPKAKLQLNWTATIAKLSAGQNLKLQAVLHNGILYVATPDGLVQALASKTGRVLWSNPTHVGLLSGPASGENLLAFGTSTPGVLVLRQTDGKLLWQAEVSSDVLAIPAISHDNLIVKTIDGRLYAFNAHTGEKQWVVDHGSPHLILKASASPKIVHEQVIVGFADGTLNAFNLRSGRQLWQRSLAYAHGASEVERLLDIDADPIINDDVIYLSSYQAYVGALSLVDGQVLWNKPASVYKNMALDAQNLYITDNNDVLWAFDRRTGFVQWRQTGLKARGVTGPAVMGGWLIVGDNMGIIHVIDVHTGMLVARTSLNSAIIFTPVVAHNQIYVMTANGQLNNFTVTAV